MKNPTRTQFNINLQSDFFTKCCGLIKQSSINRVIYVGTTNNSLNGVIYTFKCQKARSIFSTIFCLDWSRRTIDKDQRTCTTLISLLKKYQSQLRKSSSLILSIEQMIKSLKRKIDMCKHLNVREFHIIKRLFEQINLDEQL